MFTKIIILVGFGCSIHIFSFFSGPFKGWMDINNCPLERTVAQSNDSLTSLEIIESIINRSDIRDIFDVVFTGKNTNGYESTIEWQHNLAHDWVGGMMGILSSAPKDPLFFMHHAYIDYVWEMFRKKQLQLGLDPEIYPEIAEHETDLLKFHSANRTMNCFFWMKNKEGYWKNITENIYNYEPSPICPHCSNSPFLTCNTDLQRCIGIYGDIYLGYSFGHKHDFYLPSYGLSLLLVLYQTYWQGS